jgi:hypothetical protein
VQGDFKMSLFTENDARLLDKTLVIREQLIDNLLKQELPTKARDIECFTNLLESVDRSILAKAKVKVDENANKTNEETKAILKGLLLELHNNPNPVIEGTAVRVQEAPEYQPPGGVEVHSGELIPRVDNIDVKALLAQHSE